MTRTRITRVVAGASLTLAAVLVLVPASARAQALSPRYLDDFPSIDRVLAETRGRDRMDTLARQAATLHWLREAIRIMAGDRVMRERLTADEQRLMTDYASAVTRVETDAREAFGAMDRRYIDFVDARTALSRDPAFGRAIFERHLSPELQQLLSAGDDARRAWYRDNPIELPMRREPAGLEVTWYTMTGQEKLEALTAAAVCIGLIALGLWRESRPFGLHPSDPHRVRAGFGSRRLDWITGTVRGFREHTVTIVQRFTETVNRDTGSLATTGADNTEVRSYTKESKLLAISFTIEHEGGRYDVNDTHGRIRAMTGPVANPEGRRWSMIWTGKRQPEAGVPPLAFVDHHNSLAFAHQRAVSDLLAPRAWPLLPAALLGYLFGRFTDILGPFIGSSPVLSGLAMLVVFVGAYAILRWRKSATRMRHFRQQDLPRLIEATR